LMVKGWRSEAIRSESERVWRQRIGRTLALVPVERIEKASRCGQACTYINIFKVIQISGDRKDITLLDL